MKKAFLLCLLFAVSCIPGGKRRIYGSNYEGIILKGDFIPTEKDISAFETGLQGYLQNQDSFYFMVREEKELIISNLSKYKRKYSGKKEGEEKILIVEAILPECTHGLKWDDDDFRLADGGDCIIHIRYNLITGKYSDFHDNGSG